MSIVDQRKSRVKFNPDGYRELRQQLLRRDNWRCQICGSMHNLEIHHKRFRSQAGEDEEQNLITLCNSCHLYQHR